MARFQLLAGAALLLSATAAPAVETPLYEVPYVGGATSGLSPDSARNSSSAGGGYQIFGGWPIRSAHESIELRLLDHEMKPKAAGSTSANYQTSLFVDYVYDFGSSIEGSAGFFRGTKFFVGGGLGGVQEDSYGEKGTYLGADVSGGVLVPLGFKGWAVRLDGRVQGEMNKDLCNAQAVSLGQCTSEKSYLVDYYFSAGLQIPLTIFFDKPMPVAAQEPCPIAVVDPSTGRRDCGATGADGDGDGVPDLSDKCPSTARGFTVDAEGCVIAQNVNLAATLFVGKTATLSAEGRARLDDVGRMLAAQHSITVSIRALSGDAGSAAYKEMIATQRVDAIRNHLLNQGAGASQLPPGDGAAAPPERGQIAVQLTVGP